MYRLKAPILFMLSLDSWNRWPAKVKFLRKITAGQEWNHQSHFHISASNSNSGSYWSSNSSVGSNFSSLIIETWFRPQPMPNASLGLNHKGHEQQKSETEQLESSQENVSCNPISAINSWTQSNKEANAKYCQMTMTLVVLAIAYDVSKAFARS